MSDEQVAQLRRLVEQHRVMLRATEPLGIVSKPHICWATDAVSQYVNLIPQLLDSTP